MAFCVGNQYLFHLRQILIPINSHFHLVEAVVLIKRFCLSGIFIDLLNFQRLFLYRILHQDFCCCLIIYFHCIIDNYGKGMVIQIIAGRSFGFLCIIGAIVKIIALAVPFIIGCDGGHSILTGDIGENGHFHLVETVPVIERLGFSGVRIQFLHLNRFHPGLIFEQEVGLVGILSIYFHLIGQGHRKGVIINVIPLRCCDLPDVIGSVLERAALCITLRIRCQRLHQGIEIRIGIDVDFHSIKAVTAVIGLRLSGHCILLLYLNLFGCP